MLSTQGEDNKISANKSGNDFSIFFQSVDILKKVLRIRHNSLKHACNMSRNIVWEENKSARNFQVAEKQNWFI